MKRLGQINRKRRQIRNRWIGGLLVLVYGLAGVLGYGLHAVWDCGHDHGQSHSHEHHHTHGCVHHHHHHGHGIELAQGDPQGTWKATADGCPICEFLVQAQSPVLVELAKTSSGPVPLTFSLGGNSYLAPLLGIPAARGPPLA